MYTSDNKIFELIHVLKSIGMITYDNDFCSAIKVLKQNLSPIKQGKAHFTAKHIENICMIYNVNANWIFGTEKNMFIKTVNQPQKTII